MYEPILPGVKGGLKLEHNAAAAHDDDDEGAMSRKIKHLLSLNHCKFNIAIGSS